MVEKAGVTEGGEIELVRIGKLDGTPLEQIKYGKVEQNRVG